MVPRRSMKTRRRVRRTRRGRKLQSDLGLWTGGGATVADYQGLSELARASRPYIKQLARWRKSQGITSTVERKIGKKFKNGSGSVVAPSKRARSGFKYKRSYGGVRRNTGGRYGRRRTPMLSMVKSAMPKRILRFQGLVTQENTITSGGADTGVRAGYFRMSSYFNNGAAGDSQLPLYVIDLNTTPNAGVAGGNVMYRMTLASTGEPKWVAESGLNPTGALSGQWQLEYTNMFGINQQSSHYISPSWYDVRMTMYGATGQQTVFFVDLIECAEFHAPIDSMSQFFSVDTSDVQPLLGRMKDQLARYWQMNVKSLISNQLVPKMPSGQARGKMPYRRLKSWRYTIAPKDNTEVDTTPNSVTAKLFIRDGRVLNYAWTVNNTFYDAGNVSNTTGRDDVLPNPNLYDVAVGTAINANAYPYPTRRRYLVVRCVNTTNTLPAGETVVNTPSFDLCIRKKEVTQQRSSTLG